VSGFRPVGVLTNSSTGKTLRLEIHQLHSVFEQYYYVYPEATKKVMKRKKEECNNLRHRRAGVEHIRYVSKHIKKEQAYIAT
jgi:glycerol-3-phosphate cytidylyltransferase-like family protein